MRYTDPKPLQWTVMQKGHSVSYQTGRSINLMRLRIMLENSNPESWLHFLPLSRRFGNLSNKTRLQGAAYVHKENVPSYLPKSTILKCFMLTKEEAGHGG
jgi:hypothetical protein